MYRTHYVYYSMPLIPILTFFAFLEYRNYKKRFEKNENEILFWTIINNFSLAINNLIKIAYDKNINREIIFRFQKILFQIPKILTYWLGEKIKIRRMEEMPFSVGLKKSTNRITEISLELSESSNQILTQDIEEELIKIEKLFADFLPPKIKETDVSGTNK